MLVPVDDLNCMFYWIAWHETKGVSQDAWRRFCHATPGVDLDTDWRKLRTLQNDYRRDLARMKAGDFTGIDGIPTQDMAMWESMGPIADRSRDHLGGSDLAVIQFRRQMVGAAKAVAEGRPAIGTDVGVRHLDLASFEGLVPKTADWRTLALRSATAPRAAE